MEDGIESSGKRAHRGQVRDCHNVFVVSIETTGCREGRGDDLEGDGGIATPVLRCASGGGLSFIFVSIADDEDRALCVQCTFRAHRAEECPLQPTEPS